MRISIKFCGLTRESDIAEAVELGAEYLGFVFYSASPRHITPARARELRSLIPANVKAAAVVVDADDATLDEIMHTLRPNALQLHGGETPERLRELRTRYPGVMLIKAFRIAEARDFAQVAAYDEVADAYLFDARATKSALPGGTGESFDWSLLKGRSFAKPYFLSGGLTPENVREAIQLTGATQVDVSSGIERSPGVKDYARMREFAKEVRE